MNKTWHIGGLALLLAVTSGCSQVADQLPFTGPKAEIPIQETDGIKQVAAVKGEHLAVYDGKEWKPYFWSGVNLGATTPGHFPGELSPTKEDYLRWFAQMKEMHTDVVRVYTILPPHFYEALDEFNRTQEEPLRLLQGIWSPEEELIGENGEGNDAYTPEITDKFKAEIKDIVDVVHGQANLPARPGHASGEYTTDVSKYMLGWIVGTEWYQRAVQVTNERHPGAKPYHGQYFQAASDASPFESWLAEMLDTLGQAEMKYKWQHPVAFTNWVTTDPLTHPNEPLAEEDLVPVDPMHVTATDKWQAGYFASYHIYPYYPDFLRFEPKYQTYKDSEGNINPYAGYLHDMREHHKGIPLMVSEFGVPSSRGMAHKGPLDRNQGMHTEQEQGRINADLYKSIYNEGYDGAILFAWTDEWFKITWNTVELELPADRRPMWRNRLTNEEHFGLIAMEPGESADKMILLDGKTEDWDGQEHTKTQSYADFDLTVTHDEAHVYLLLQKKQGSWDWSRDKLDIGFDVLKGGSTTADIAPGVTFSKPAEFLLHMEGPEASRLLVNSAYDPFSWLYGEVRKELPHDPRYRQAEAGLFLPWNLALSRALYLPSMKQQIPFETLEVGVMKPGITDPADKEFNSLADWYAKDGVLEIRIPWMMLGYTDPGTQQVWNYPYEVNGYEPVASPGINVEPVLRDKMAGAGVLESTGHAAKSATEEAAALLYSWEKWDLPVYHERKKAGFDMISEAFGEHNEVKK
ncbi:hypothetical protein [Brevibacillus dissolubilis]|uniref:hypothetical protein n=1 Tax=Brevibacillus dissolubilis TaxID=1844116 RepID=UPI001116F204|nr:hypothetical protein [Brevibacillus dissolubilis]